MSEIIMPKMGDAMTEGKVIRWYKQPGDKVSKGEPVLEIETDKVNLDLEAEADGTLGELAVAEGSMAQVGEVLAIVDDGKGGRAKKAAKPQPSEAAEGTEGDEEKTPETQAPKDVQPEAARPEVAEKKDRSEKSGGSTQPKQSSAAVSGDRRVPSSPLARRMAAELGVDLGNVTGSGPNGRVVAADIEAASKGAAPKGTPRQEAPSGAPRQDAPLAPAQELSSSEIPLTAMRRTIAKRLVESLGPVPHFFLTIDVDVTELLGLRKRVNEIAQNKTSVNDFVIRAAARAIHHHPYVNASFTGDAIRQLGNVHVGVAVATAEGLITPVIRDADNKSVSEIAGEVRDLAERAKNRKLRPEEYQGSTFTISNLGMFGIEEFTAIINPPNAAILAVGAAGPKPVVVDGQIVVRERMKITMSCDHRVIDGAAGADYLKTLREYLENPLRILV